MATLDDDELLAHLADQGRLLAGAFARCDPAAAVPGLDWDARTVVIHLGAVHRWAADIVRRALPTNETGGSRAFTDPDLTGGELADWYEQGLTDLVATLRAAPADLSCFSFLRDVPARRFWIRRQAHETAVHRVDVEAAAGGPVTGVPADFAQNGLGELVGGFARQRSFATDRPGRLLLAASDGPAWLVTFGGERNRVESGAEPDPPADAVVRGSSDELYRWAWNRPVAVVETGDPAVLGCWRRVRIG